MTPVAPPELPEPHGWLHDARGNDPLTFVRVMPEFLKLCTSSMPVYSHAQIQAAVLAERAAERERCAKIAEEKFLPAHLQHEWEKICSREIASAIRAQTIRESAIEGKGLSAIRNQP